jgi:hypothetical protein
MNLSEKWIAITCRIISFIKSKSIGSLLREIFMAKVKTPHKCHIGKERVKAYLTPQQVMLQLVEPHNHRVNTAE